MIFHNYTIYFNQFRNFYEILTKLQDLVICEKKYSCMVNLKTEAMINMCILTYEYNEKTSAMENFICYLIQLAKEHSQQLEEQKEYVLTHRNERSQAFSFNFGKTMNFPNIQEFNTEVFKRLEL